MSEVADETEASVLLVFEDRSGPVVLGHLLAAIARYLVPYTNPPKSRAIPEALRRGAKPSSWLSQDPAIQRDFRLIVQQIATTLIQARGFVIFHADGDVTWSKHKAGQGINRSNFDSIVKNKLKQFLLTPPYSVDRAQEKKASAKAMVRSAPSAKTVNQRAVGGQSTVGKVTPPSEETVNGWLSKLFLWMPFYSIESWLYTNQQNARKHCAASHPKCSGERCIGFILQENPLVDDVHMPKDSCCLSDEFNKELAETFTANLVDQGEKQGASMAEAVRPMKAHREWMASLADARPMWCRTLPSAAGAASEAEGQADGGVGPTPEN